MNRRGYVHEICDTNDTNENPQAFHENHFQHRWSINLWTGIIGDKLIGAVVLPELLSSENYLIVLMATMEEYLEDPILTSNRDLIFQQDGAPAYYGLNVYDYLNCRHQVWIRCARPIFRPLCSADFTPSTSECSISGEEVGR